MHTDYDDLIWAVAQQHGVDGVLLQAIVAQESGGDPHAHRVEPHYLTNAVVKREATAWSRRWQGTPTALTETTDRASSWGLTQMLGQTAREAGLAARYLTALSDPGLNLEWACRLLTRWAGRAKSVEHLSAMWNGGPGVRWPLAATSPVRPYVAKVTALRQQTPYGEGRA
jgi:soluble lytic murein transglycosylase-like protein